MRSFVLLVLLAGHALCVDAVDGLRGRWITVIATAYSPDDELDRAYRETKGAERWLTAHRVDVRVRPYGIAAPRSIAAGTRFYIPAGQGYLDQTMPEERIFTVDDTGGEISRRTDESAVLHLDLRYRTERSALRFGRRALVVFLVDDRAGAL